MSYNNLIISSACRISADLNRLKLEKITAAGLEKPQFRPAEDLNLVIIEAPQTTLSLGALQLMMRYQVGLICCDEKHLPTGLMMPLVGSTLQGKYQSIQIKKTEKAAPVLWQQIVSQKIKNQAIVLSHINQSHPRLLRLAERVSLLDTQSHEGQAARIYFPLLFGESFFRDPEGSFPNTQLNYGYAILRSMMAKALVGAGLQLHPGLFHRNQYNPFPLADDLMEPYRPLVDWLVYRYIWQEEQAESPLITTDQKALLVNVLHRDIMCNGRLRAVHHAMCETATSLCQHYMGVSRGLVLPEVVCH